MICLLIQVARFPKWVAAGALAGVMTAPFVLAVPSKGRLQENAEAFFSRAGLALAKPGGARDYRGTIAGLDNWFESLVVEDNMALVRGPTAASRRAGSRL